MSDATTTPRQGWLGPGVAGIGTASFLADVGHEIPTALLPNLLTATLGAPAAGYTTTAILSSLIGAATAVWQVAVLRAGAWAARGLRVPARNALLADIGSWPAPWPGASSSTASGLIAMTWSGRPCAWPGVAVIIYAPRAS